jgi:hypothetical protein
MNVNNSNLEPLSDNFYKMSDINNVNTLNSQTYLFLGLNWKIWIIIIVILAFLGINIFVYLARGTQTIADFLKPISIFLNNIIGTPVVNTSKQIVNVSATGIKSGVDTVTNVLDKGVSNIQQSTNPNISASSTGSTVHKNTEVITTNQAGVKTPQDDSLTTILKNAYDEENNGDYKADDSFSRIQSGGRSGWCYIGEEQGFRSCIQVGDNDTCMSGDIFPTNDICINPSLRS